jgi:hypothetical protein
MTRKAYTHLAQTAVLFLLAATCPGLASEVDGLLAWKASLVDTAALSSWTKATPVCS